MWILGLQHLSKLQRRSEEDPRPAKVHLNDRFLVGRLFAQGRAAEQAP